MKPNLQTGRPIAQFHETFLTKKCFYTFFLQFRKIKKQLWIHYRFQQGRHDGWHHNFQDDEERLVLYSGFEPGYGWTNLFKLDNDFRGSRVLQSRCIKDRANNNSSSFTTSAELSFDIIFDYWRRLGFFINGSFVSNNLDDLTTGKRDSNHCYIVCTEKW